MTDGTDDVYACVCHAVTEDAVRSQVAAGTGTARSVWGACGIGRGCGACARKIYALIRESESASGGMARTAAAGSRAGECHAG